MMIFSDAARSWGFPPLALCMADNDKLSIFSYPPHPTPHTLHPTPDVFVKNIPLKGWGDGEMGRWGRD
ncbi:hypothetical protein [Moorena bouillonii]|uniref:hypothetical protein n=1 Tax=Moorena bouillonii TaxID=207920 RepID=UPI00117D8B3C|nr:hypothetical protein [Moorena bouillonii]